jgi:hypothetical protein
MTSRTLPPVAATIFGLALIILGGAVPAHAQRRGAAPPQPRVETWIKFDSPEGGFSAEFPEKPSVRQTAVKSGAGELLSRVIETDPARDRYFRVSYVDFKDSPASSTELQDAGLTELIEGELKNGGSLQYRTNTGQGSCNGKEASLSTKNPVTKKPELVRVRTFSSGDRLYLITYRERASVSADPEVGTHFLESFFVTGGCQPRWLTFTSAEGGFTAKFPERPELATDTPHPDQPNYVRSVIELTTDQGRHFEISYVNFQGELADIEWAKNDGLTRLIDSYTEQGGKLIGRETVTRGECRGLQASMQITHPVFHMPVVLKARVFASHKTIYLVYYAGNADTAVEGELADEFLNSFDLTKNCQATTDALPVRPVEPEVESTLDPATGWQRVDSPFGVKFLMPERPLLHSEQLPTTTGVRFIHAYADLTADHGFSLEVIDVRPNAPMKSLAEQTGLLLSFEEPTFAEFSQRGITFGAGKPVVLGTLPGRDYPLTLVGTRMTGRARLVMTPTRLVRIVAVAPPSAAGREQMERFINSVVIEPK